MKNCFFTDFMLQSMLSVLWFWWLNCVVCMLTVATSNARPSKWATFHNEMAHTITFVNWSTPSCKLTGVPTAKRMCRHTMMVIHSVHWSSFQFGASLWWKFMPVMSGGHFGKVTYATMNVMAIKALNNHNFCLLLQGMRYLCMITCVSHINHLLLVCHSWLKVTV